MGVEVETRFPELLIEARRLVPNPEKVIVEEVAMRPAVERVPEIRVFPWTEKREPGEVVPMPTFPPCVASKTVLVAVRVLPKKEVPDT